MTLKEYRDKGFKGNLIPVHINKCRDTTHFWDWSSDIGDWVRGEKIPEKLIRLYNTPLIKSNYN